ncbi:MAG: hypothetical protein ACK4R6_04640 [Spirosomataceae bacterium]
MMGKFTMIRPYRLAVSFLSALVLWTVLSPKVWAQSATAGSVFVGSGGQLVIADSHTFIQGSGINSSGMIGTERISPYGLVSFLPGATWTGASNDAFVDGYVRKYGTGLFVFPVGDNGVYRPIRTSGGSTQESFTSVAYFGANPGVAITSSLAGPDYLPLPIGAPFAAATKQAALATISANEYWDIDGTEAVIVSLSYNANSNVGSISSNNLDKLTLVGWHIANAQWEEIPSLVDETAFLGGLSNLTTGSVSSTSAIVPNTYAVITLGGLVNARIVDSDGDGVPDADDQCPLVAGVAPSGCPAGVQIAAKVYLQGALFGVSGSLMRDDLRAKNLLPITNPYTALGYVGMSSTGTLTNTVLAVTGDNALVDWVFLELRSSTDQTAIVDSRAALVQRDGDIVDLDGISPVSFATAPINSYYVVVRHRNHLGVMTANPVALTATATTVDFTSASTSLYRVAELDIHQPTVAVTQGRALWAGNVLINSTARNTIAHRGTDNEINPIYQLITQSTANQIMQSPLFKLKTYNLGDVNMNGEAVFQGAGNDTEFIYLNVLKNHTGNGVGSDTFIIQEQIP